MGSLIVKLFPDSGPQITQVQQVRFEIILKISVINIALTILSQMLYDNAIIYLQLGGCKIV